MFREGEVPLDGMGRPPSLAFEGIIRAGWWWHESGVSRVLTRSASSAHSEFPSRTAFARRESAKCQMCHFRLPELNEDEHSSIRRGLREERGGG